MDIPGRCSGKNVETALLKITDFSTRNLDAKFVILAPEERKKPFGGLTRYVCESLSVVFLQKQNKTLNAGEQRGTRRRLAAQAVRTVRTATSRGCVVRSCVSAPNELD